MKATLKQWQKCLTALLTWQDYMDICKVMLSKADTIAMLPDYKDSKGALQELEWAREQGKVVVYEEEI